VQDDEDGMSWLTAYVPSVEAHAVFHRLTDVARAIDDPTRAGAADVEPIREDPRTLDQRRADLLVDFLAGDWIADGENPAAAAERVERRAGRGLDLGRFAGIRPTVVVTVPVQALLDTPDAERTLGSADPPMLDGVVPIDPATARALTANAPTLYRLLTDPHTGARLDLSRRSYAPSTDLRLWLRLRDETCRFPGCGRLAKGCDIDHTIDWQYGGATRPDNLAHLCRGHHTLKHETACQPRQHADGTITWRSPSGRVHATRPARSSPT